MSKFNFDRVVKNMEQLKRELPPVLANQAQNYFVRTFTAQGFAGKSWKEVKRRQDGTPENKYPKRKGLSRRTKPILVGTGALRRAVSNSIRSATFNSIRLVVDLPYAIAQQYGTEHIDARPYMGDNAELRDQQRKTIMKTVDRIWQA